MLAWLRQTPGNSLVVLAKEDEASARLADAFLQVAFPKFTIVHPGQLASAPTGFGVIAVFCSSKNLRLKMETIALCLDKLRPGGYMIARIRGISEEASAELLTSGLFAGAVRSKVGREFPMRGLLDVEFSCIKPNWSKGASASLGNSVAKINEDELLGEVPRPVGQGKDDCSSKPKACANCSCGRKELEERVGAEEAKKQLEKGTQRSACGSCYLGDAFRCDGCPYRGLPAFKPGSKVELSATETDGTGQLDMRVLAEDENILAGVNEKVVLTT